MNRDEIAVTAETTVYVPVIVYCYECSENMEITHIEDDGKGTSMICVTPCPKCKETK